MKVILILLAILAAASASSQFLNPKISELLENKFIKKSPTSNETPTADISISLVEQRIDHFNPQDTRTFNQRVYKIDQYYQSGGPILVFFGGFDYIIDPQMTGFDLLLLNEIANMTNAVVYSFENRYFGESIPTDDLSTANLQYLTVEQILGDYAVAIYQFRAEYAEFGTTKVMAFGYNTGGSLATWMRQKYPHLVDAVWSTSGPVFAKMEFINYLPDVASTIQEHAGIECYNRIEGAFQRMESVIQSGNATELEELFNLYEPIDLVNAQDIGTFFNTMATIVTVYVEYTNVSTLNGFCQELLNPEIDDDLEAYAALIRNLFGEDTVLHVSYREAIEIYSQIENDSLAAISGARSRYYFICSQLSWFRTSSGSGHPFGFRFPLGLYTQACRDVFDESFTNEMIQAKNERINIQFGGFNPGINFGYFTNGEFDPFRLQGITEDLNLFSFADVIPLTGKGSDILAFSEYDSDELTAVKNRIVQLIFSILEN